MKYELLQIEEALRTDSDSEQIHIKPFLPVPANRRGVLVAAIVGLSAQWCGNSVVSYYLILVLDGVGITDATDQSLINRGL